MKMYRILCTALLALVIFVACGGSGNNDTAEASPSPAPTAAPYIPTNDPPPEPAPTPFPIISSPHFTPVTAWDMMGRLGMGINIGNTMEATGDWFEGCVLTEMETIWGAARIAQWHFQAIAAKGFDTVRIPINWGTRMDDALTIHPDWMRRVQEVVDWALDAGLYVIINAHHEATLYGHLHQRELYEAERWLEAVWGQIGAHFGYYPETLIFEPWNEPRPGIGGWYWDPVGQLPRIHSLADATNGLNHFALQVIRNSGGYNANRIVKLVTVQADANLIYTYTHPENDPFVMLGVFLYPGREENQLEQIENALAQHIPVAIKETSPIDDWPLYQRLEWAQWIYAELAALGVPSMWWNTSGTSYDVLFCRATGRWINPELLAAFFAAYGAALGAGIEPPMLFPLTLATEVNEGFNSWDISYVVKEAADSMVVRTDGTIYDNFTFARWTMQEGWVEYTATHERVTVGAGSIVLDMRGLTGGNLHFALWDAADHPLVYLIYLTGYLPN